MRTTGGAPVEGRPPEVLRHLGAALPRQWRRYRKRLQRCQRRFSEGAVHDSRVETRRLLALLELLAAFIPARELAKPRRTLKEHLAAFDHLRDTQVQLGCVEPMRRAFPAAQKFHAWLCHREVRFIRAARQAVKRIKTRRVGKRIALFEEELGCQRKKLALEPAFAIALETIRLAFARVVRLCRRADAPEPKTIHRTRIAFKRFRYMVEELLPLLPAVTGQYREAMRGYQKIMGEVQDLRVLLTALDKFMEQEDGDPPVQRLRAGFVRRREKLIRGYVKTAHELQSFWPPKALSPRSLADKSKQP